MLEKGVADLGLAGNTATETATTISGSLNAAKSAWSNLVTGIADDNANFEQLVENFVDSATVAAENIIPRIEIALQGAGEMIDEVVPIIIEKIPDFIEKYLPKILESGISIVLQIVAGLVKSIPKLVETAPKLVGAILNAFNSNADTFLDIGKQIVSGVWKGISSMIKWFTDKVKGFFSGIVDGVKDTLGIHSPSKVFAGIGGFMAEGLVDGWEKEYNGIKRSIENGLNFGTASVDFSSSGLSQSSRAISNGIASGSAAAGGEIVINITETIDGAILARNQYKYNMREGTLRGGSLVEVGGS